MDTGILRNVFGKMDPRVDIGQKLGLSMVKKKKLKIRQTQEKNLSISAKLKMQVSKQSLSINYFFHSR